MNLTSKIDKIEKQLQGRDLLEDARRLVEVYIQVGSYPSDVDVEELAKEYAVKGIGLRVLLDEIAKKGPELPRGTLKEMQDLKHERTEDAG